jgi:hypothetical protein
VHREGSCVPCCEPLCRSVSRVAPRRARRHTSLPRRQAPRTCCAGSPGPSAAAAVIARLRPATGVHVFQRCAGLLGAPLLLSLALSSLASPPRQTRNVMLSGFCVKATPLAVMGGAWDWRALRMNGPAGATVADCGARASSGARRNVARSPRSPGAPPCTRSPTILGCTCADRCSHGSWSRWRACRVGATRPHAPRRSLRSDVVRLVFYCRAVCCRVASRASAPAQTASGPAGEAGGRSALPCVPWQPLAAASCCGVFLPPQEAQCNPGGATSRPGASALPIARNGSPLDMACIRRDWKRAGRRKKNKNAAATGPYGPGDAEHNV